MGLRTYIYSMDPDSYQLQQALGLLGDPPRVVRGVRSDWLKQLILIVTLERWLTNQHFIHQHAKRPPVHWEGVLLSKQDLRLKTDSDDASDINKENKAAQTGDGNCKITKAQQSTPQRHVWALTLLLTASRGDLNSEWLHSCVLRCVHFDGNIVEMWHHMEPQAYLWSNIVRCATECCGSGFSKHIFLAHAKVCYLYVSIPVQHDIVQLQIPEEGHKTICNQFCYSMVCLKHCTLIFNTGGSGPIYSVALTVWMQNMPNTAALSICWVLPVDDSFRVEELQSHYYLRSIEPDC